MPKLSPAYKCVSPLPPASRQETLRLLSPSFMAASRLSLSVAQFLRRQHADDKLLSCSRGTLRRRGAVPAVEATRKTGSGRVSGSSLCSPAAASLSFFFFTSLRFLLGESEASVKTWNRKKTEFQTDAGEPCLCLEQ